MKGYIAGTMVALAALCSYASAQERVNVSPKGIYQSELEQALKNSGECEGGVYWTSLPPNKKGELRTVICDKLVDGKNTYKFGINLDNISEVHLQENNPWYVFGFLVGDDIIVESSKGKGQAYTLRFNDDSAKQVYDALQDIIRK